jgi:hypothetical protein
VVLLVPLLVIGIAIVAVRMGRGRKANEVPPADPVQAGVDAVAADVEARVADGIAAIQEAEKGLKENDAAVVAHNEGVKGDVQAWKDDHDRLDHARGGSDVDAVIYGKRTDGNGKR